MKYIILILLIFLLQGCAKMTGARIGGVDQLAGIQMKIEEQNNKIAGIEELQAKFDTQLSAQGSLQAGLINRTENLSNTLSAGRDSMNMTNDPRITIILAYALGVAILAIFVIMIIFIIYTGKSRKMIIEALKTDPRVFIQEKD